MPHDYLSTACYHGQHDKCRLACKFCSAECRCICHIPVKKKIAVDQLKPKEEINK